MIRLIGAGMICISTAIIGFRVASAGKTRVQVLSDFVIALEMMIAEISCLLTPIKEILEKLAMQTKGPLGNFFYRCLCTYEETSDAPFAQVWNSALETAGNLCLNESDMRILSEIGNSFGRYSSDEQCRMLQGIKEELYLRKTQAEKDQMKNGRVYRSLGITCGIALVILLI